MTMPSRPVADRARDMAEKGNTPLVEPKAGQETTLAQQIGRAAGGSKVDDFNARLVDTTLPCVWVQHGPDENKQAAQQQKAMVATLAAMSAFKPVDEIEGMLAAQAVALHGAAMECLRRAMLPGQSPEGASKLRRDGTNMARAVTDMIEALDRKRGKGSQHIRVERVMVADGGQAIVGNVTHGAVPAAVPRKRRGVPG